MKSQTSIARVICIVIALAMVLAGCSNGKPPEPDAEPVKYIVTVSGGTGQGEFAAGTDCTVAATVPAGKTFVEWTVNGSQVSTAASYTFKVTGNTQIVAKFTGTYTISVTEGVLEGGETCGSYPENSSVKITADAPGEGMEFSGWEVGGVQWSASNPYTFTLNRDMDIKATYRVYDPLAEICAVTVEGGNGSGTYNINSIVTVVADPPKEGKVFDYWKIDGAQVSKSEMYTFIVTKDTTVVAMFINENDQKLETQSGMFTRNHWAGQGDNVARFCIDRGNGTASQPEENSFTKNEYVDHMVVYVYTTRGAGAVSIGQFKFVFRGLDRPRLETMDGTATHSVSGRPGDYYLAGDSTPEQKATALQRWKDFMTAVLGEQVYSDNATYYYGFQLMATANTDGWVDSDIFTPPSNANYWCYNETPLPEPASNCYIAVVGGAFSDGSTSGRFASGTELTVKADEIEGKVFSKWTVYGVGVSTSSEYTFIATQDTTLRAVHINPTGNTKLVSQPGQFYKINNNNLISDPNLSIDRGTNISPGGWGTGTITANAYCDFMLIYVYSSSSPGSIPLGAFKMVFRGVNCAATNVNANIMTLDGKVVWNNFRGQPRSYNLGWGTLPNYPDQVLIETNNFRTFIRAVIGNAYSDDGTYFFATQLIALPNADGRIDSDIGAICPNYWRYNGELPPEVVKYTVTVTGGGTIVGGGTSGEFESGTQVSVTAPAAEEGYILQWKVNDTVVSTANPYTFAVTGNITIAATYAEKAVETQKLATRKCMFTRRIWGTDQGNVIARFSIDRGETDAKIPADQSFTANEFVDHMVVSVYTSTGSSAVSVGQFKFVFRGLARPRLETMDGSATHSVSGSPGDYFLAGDSTPEIKATALANWEAFMMAVLGTNYSQSTRYYYGFQLIATQNTEGWIDSDIVKPPSDQGYWCYNG